ncbi:MAG: FHA domain-containing protein, partial [Myxococcaceae bacterium]
MLTVRDARALRGTMTLGAFTSRLGAFALIQAQPPPETSLTVLWTAAPGRGSGTTFRVGRAPDSDLVVENSSVSKRHAELRWAHGRCSVVDLDSTNGTFVNDIEVEGELELNDRDRVVFGHVRFVYVLTESLYRLLRPTPEQALPDLEKTQPEYRPAAQPRSDEARTITERVPLVPELPPIRRQSDPNEEPTTVVPIIT